ncbi:MAG TPA: mechanosensitive ion channel family protein [Mycobacteriales bacterium]|nr:mechanosensitive ion channel family protein [Mycobacteriales bacterium]
MPLRLAIPHREWLAQHWQGLAIGAGRILLIVLLALAVRALVNRAIQRVTRAGEGAGPALLRPLRERALPGLLEGSKLLEGRESTALLSERRKQRAETLGSILRSITSFAVLALALMLILGELGLNLGPIIASAGIVGVALGFGAQNLVKDFISGVFMLLEDQYGVGDVIDVGEATGSVEEVGLRVTRLRDIYGTVWYVRNGEIIRVGNKSQGFARVVLDVPVAQGADLERAGHIMRETAETLRADDDWSQSVLEDPKYLGVEQINPDGVVLRLTVKVRPGEQWRVGRELRRRIIDRFDAEDVSMPCSTEHIHIHAEGPPAR